MLENCTITFHGHFLILCDLGKACLGTDRQQGDIMLEMYLGTQNKCTDIYNFVVAPCEWL